MLHSIVAGLLISGCDWFARASVRVREARATCAPHRLLVYAPESSGPSRTFLTIDLPPVRLAAPALPIPNQLYNNEPRPSFRQFPQFRRPPAPPTSATFIPPRAQRLGVVQRNYPKPDYALCLRMRRFPFEDTGWTAGGGGGALLSPTASSPH
jgi:hypothetical protein